MARRPKPRTSSQPTAARIAKPDPQLQRAIELLKAGRNAEAQAIVDPIVAKRPKDSTAVRTKGLVEMRSGRYAAAEIWFQKFARLDPRNPISCLDQASVHKYHGRFPEMIAACREALRRSPGHHGAEAMLARALESSGDLEGAYEHLRSVGGRRSLDPDSGECLIAVLDLLGRHDEALDAATGFLKASGPPPVLRRRVLLRRGRMLEKRGELDEALASFEEGQAQVPATFDPDAYDRRMDEVAAAIPEVRPLGADDEGPVTSRVPVTIAGLPRSGTSLVERILGAHPDAGGVGEASVLQDVIREHGGDIGEDRALGPFRVETTVADSMRRLFLTRARELAGPVDRVVSKHLQNWAFVAHLSFLFPGAAIIRLERDPAANAISILGQDLPPDRMAWATRLDWIGRLMRTERRFIEAVRPKLPNPWLDLRYEDLVADPARWIPEIVAVTGLPWNEACLEPHRAEAGGDGRKAARFQPTLSLHQVRQPISGEAAKRAERWGSRLDGFRRAFESGG